MFTVRIMWGEKPEPDDEPSVYHFETEELLNAFLQGVDAAVGWLDHVQLNEDESWCSECSDVYKGDACSGCSTVHVCMSAFDEDNNYTDDPDLIRGWTVYVRTEPDEGGMFEILEEADFVGKENATAHTHTMARKYNTTDIREF